MSTQTKQTHFTKQTLAIVRMRTAAWLMSCPAYLIHTGMGLRRFEAL
ncbi:MAG: hypothetical protein KBC91_02970 [Candidatus Omnitrophica bacterium]|nr:hypothetical protein [Candidatus Omnitrophota bacterium]